MSRNLIIGLIVGVALLVVGFLFFMPSTPQQIDPRTGLPVPTPGNGIKPISFGPGGTGPAVGVAGSTTSPQVSVVPHATFSQGTVAASNGTCPPGFIYDPTNGNCFSPGKLSS